jgi:hypothetical protein
MQDAINKGYAAKTLEEPVRLAVERVKDALMRRWRVCTDRDERDRIWLSMGIADQIALAISAVVADGKMAEKALADIEQGRHKLYGVA